MRLLPSFSILLFLCPQLLLADSLVALPPGDFTCAVEITPGPPPSAKPGIAPANPAPAVTPGVFTFKSILIRRKENLRNDSITCFNGDKSESWTFLDTGLTLFERSSGGGKSIYRIPSGSVMRYVFAPPILDLSPTSVGWVTLASCTGKVMYGGTRPALHYQAVLSIPRENLPPTTALYQAWVDAKTMQPIAFHDGRALYSLTFSDPPSEPLTVPPEIKNDLQQYENATATLKHL